MSPVTVDPEDSVTLPACTITRTDYRFAGWSTVQNGADTYDTADLDNVLWISATGALNKTHSVYSVDISAISANTTMSTTDIYDPNGPGLVVTADFAPRVTSTHVYGGRLRGCFELC